jgi:hypothetical protein
MAKAKRKGGTRRRARAAGYKSGLEQQLHLGLMKNAEYEPAWAEVQYTVTKTYKPDFAFESQPGIVYESKGRFRIFDEAKKYIHVRDSNPGLVIRFIIPDPKQKAYPQTKMSLGDWLTKQGFEWCTDTTVPKEWRS